MPSIIYTGKGHVFVVDGFSIARGVETEVTEDIARAVAHRSDVRVLEDVSVFDSQGVADEQDSADLKEGE